MNLPDEIPLFPLGIVLYPGETLSLHIFEDRYKEMVRFCMDDDHPFGIVLYDGGKMAGMGCSARIVSIPSRYPDGGFDIEIVGQERFRVGAVTDDGSYMRCRPEWLKTELAVAEGRQTQRLIAQHMKLLEIAGRTVRPEFYDQSQAISYLVARNAGLELTQKQVVLETDDESDRVAFLIDHMARFIPKVEQGEEIRRKVRSNGHFADFPPEEL